ncbi:MAG: hypothetical protein ACOC44_18950 [Promethearchaeia archaeon]
MKKKENNLEEDIDNLLDQALKNQANIHHRCKIRDDPAKKKKEWEEKYEKKKE